MENFDLTYAALLFPAIPLMMISFGNRYSSLSILIRKIHDEFINKKITSKDKSASRYLSQLKILSKRLKFVKAIQTISAFAVLFNLLSILIGIFNNSYIPGLLFVFALIFFCVAMILFMVEIQLSSIALQKHIEDLEEI